MSLKKTATGDFLDPRTFGELLDLNRESVYKAIARRELKAVRIGRAIRLPRAQLDAMLAEDESNDPRRAEEIDFDALE